MNSISSLLSAEVEFVALLCPGEQLPPPCEPHPIILADGIGIGMGMVKVGIMPRLIFPPLVVVDVDFILFPEGHVRLHGEGDPPHTGHRNSEHS